MMRADPNAERARARNGRPTHACAAQIALSHSGRMLFAGTDAGTIRSYKFPLTGDYAEIQIHSGPVTRLRVTHDDAYLFSVSEDSTVFICDVRDKEGRGAKRDKEIVAFAEEILVTKSDLEEKTQSMAELKQKVEELTMQNEYQLRLKDLNYTEKIKEATDKFNAELDGDKKNYELLLQSKNDMEMEYEEKIKQLEERHQQQLQALEAQYQQKIMTEVERYTQLVAEKDLMNEKWEEQLAAQREEHERLMQETADNYLERLQEECSVLDREKSEKEGLIQEFDETRKQLEEDVDREVEELKEKYEAKLASEREAALRLKGENGIMRKKFTALQKEIADHETEIAALNESKKVRRAGACSDAVRGAILTPPPLRITSGALRAHLVAGEGHRRPEEGDPRARRDHWRQGEADLRPEEKESGAREVQVCARLQDQGAQEAD